MKLNWIVSQHSLLQTPSTSLVREHQDDHLLLLSTLDGSLFAVNRLTGITQWQLKDGKCLNVSILWLKAFFLYGTKKNLFSEPVVKVPVDASKAVT